MRVYYCDGSSHKKKGKIGIGIVGKDIYEYIEKDYCAYKEMSHEVEAIIKTIESLNGRCYNIKIINDDKCLVGTIKSNLQGIKVRSQGLNKQPRFHFLMELIRKYKIEVGTPNSEQDRDSIRKCHNLSRRYMLKNKNKKKKEIFKDESKLYG